MSALPQYEINRGDLVVRDKPRVAFFQAYWRMHSNVAYAVLLLAEAGFFVDVFLYSVDNFLVGSMLDGVDNISIHVLDSEAHLGSNRPSTPSASTPSKSESGVPAVDRSLPARFRRLARRTYTTGRRAIDAEYGLLPSRAYDYTFEMTRKHRYKALIGVEKGGLLWAGRTARRSATPLIYFNLELYTRDHGYCSKPFHHRLKVAEEKYHRKCMTTIIQDERRAKVLLEDNQVPHPMHLLFVPISRLDGPVRSNSNWLHSNLGISPDTILILMHGLITKHRLSVDLARTAQSFSKEWKLVFHGWGSQQAIDEIRAVDSNDRVCLSLNLVSPSEEAQLVGSAHIGLVIYSDKYINDRLTAFASEKIALYLQCGLPIIAFGYEGYEHIETERCGVLIKSIADLPAAIKTIMNDYQGYRSRAFACFERHYKFENNYKKVIDALTKLP